MLDLKFIRENLDAVRKNCADRNVRVDLARFTSLDEKRRTLIQGAEEIRREQNENAKSMKAKLSDQEKTALIEKGKELKQRAVDADAELAEVEKELDLLVREIPNMTHPSAPVAAGEEGNREIRRWGEPAKFSFKPLDHVQLGEKLDLIDFESGAKVAGQKFYYLKNEAVLLENALIAYALSILRRKGFVPIMTPDLARASILDGIGFNPRGEETQIYSVENSDLCLIATAEITLGGMLSDTVLSESELPKKYVGVSHCFRTEAGAAGRESKGLYRVHQFTKIEMFAFTTPESSEEMHEEFVGLEEKIFQGLGIPYRVLDICTGDLGGPAYRKYDLEAWMPGRGESGEWGEVTSTSNCTDYQARRLKVRFKREADKKTFFVHMLNGTAIAVSRAIISILENYQQEDGSVLIPKPLLPYMDGIERIGR
ncbi:MAG TPA: serine--tRNA ligase [bacterium]|jgi:seryl-tRNA synthetase|nr:serine--tRNA ligase [Myxococcales bacterium]HPW45902.1 serine--tRNA ligase [bacterium]HQG13220.1 serine--tRNA ligase [bacterium]HQH80738.1 serine--tRNA ligase [bacterium]